MDALARPPTSGIQRWCRPRATGHRLALLGVGLAMAVAGCSGGSKDPGVAQVASTTPATAPSSGRASSTTTGAGPFAYAACMRSHGVPNFPDPDSQGRIIVSGGPGSALDPASPQFQAAQRACGALGPKAATPAQRAEQVADALRFATCMRAHGLTNFPDPNAQGGILIQGNGSADLNPTSPQFQAAQRACGHLLGPAKQVTSHGAGGSGSGTVSGPGGNK